MRYTKLPIHYLTYEDFSEFKKKYLDSKFLNDNSIQAIRELFEIPKNYHVNCNEQHVHEYKCLNWKNPEAGVVERLILELENYRTLLGEINKKSTFK